MNNTAGGKEQTEVRLVPVLAVSLCFPSFRMKFPEVVKVCSCA